MSRYIDFEIAREYLHKACEGIGSNGGLMLKIKFDEEPTADVVEVVRCKDCKWYDGNECFEQLGLVCARDDDYCSYGERREDEI